MDMNRENALSYAYQAERRSPETKTILKWILVLGIAVVASFLFYSVYLAWATHPNHLTAFAVIFWIMSITVSVMTAWSYMKQAHRLQAELDTLRGLQPPQPKRPQPMKVQPTWETTERDIDDIIQELHRGVEDMSYYDLGGYMKRYPQSTKLKGIVLNYQKYWLRGNHPQWKTRRQIKAERELEESA